MTKRSGYITVSVEVDENVSVNEFIDELKDEDLVDEIRERNLESNFRSGLTSKGQIYAYHDLCDFMGVIYYTKLDILMGLLKDKISDEISNILK